MNDLEEIIARFKALDNDTRTYCIVYLLSQGIIKYEDITKGYVQYLKGISDRAGLNNNVLSSILISAFCGKKKDRESNLVQAVIFKIENKQINTTIDELKEKYPNIDIDKEKEKLDKFIENSKEMFNIKD